MHREEGGRGAAIAHNSPQGSLVVFKIFLRIVPWHEKYFAPWHAGPEGVGDKRSSCLYLNGKIRRHTWWEEGLGGGRVTRVRCK